ncbi:hypothetical protein [Magnetospirillum sp. 64-120]|mgnify:CR=1 FL=1|uniref:hypothetical protein n=1 Tax=Magnetospirillum sp. 64-120 TaxID=1895778 RepID=UPI000927AB0B|nr:hypothetical protein [Magnetospirillum sp. 64-120]OJX80897.1 MAG: hypothetical protein BGO92_07290 [Magnetospirillum sp. 64-120]
MLFDLIDTFVDKFSPVPQRSEACEDDVELNSSGRTAQDRYLDSFYDNARSLRSSRPFGDTQC